MQFSKLGRGIGLRSGLKQPTGKSFGLEKVSATNVCESFVEELSGQRTQCHRFSLNEKYPGTKVSGFVLLVAWCIVVLVRCCSMPVTA